MARTAKRLARVRGGFLGGAGREAAIRRMFMQMGPEGATAEQLAQACLHAGFWSGDEVESLAIDGAKEQVRRALRARDESGLPWAGPTQDRRDTPNGAPIWRRRPFWTYQDYERIVGQLLAARQLSHDQARVLAQEARFRFPDSPAIRLGGIAAWAPAAEVGA